MEPKEKILQTARTFIELFINSQKDKKAVQTLSIQVTYSDGELSIAQHLGKIIIPKDYIPLDPITDEKIWSKVLSLDTLSKSMHRNMPILRMIYDSPTKTVSGKELEEKLEKLKELGRIKATNLYLPNWVTAFNNSLVRNTGCYIAPVQSWLRIDNPEKKYCLTSNIFEPAQSLRA